MASVKAKSGRDMMNFIKGKAEERGEFISILKITMDSFADELHDLKRVEELIKSHVYTTCPQADAICGIKPYYLENALTGFDIELYALPKQEKPDAIVEVLL